MKTRILIYFTVLLLFNSCIVNSLFPFFTEDTISFEKTFLGIWEDDENSDSRWVISSLEDFSRIQIENDSTSLSKKELDFYNKYKHGYYAIHEEIKNNRISTFLAVPFKIDNQLFLDFTPVYYDEHAKGLVSQHLIPTHTLAKFDVLDNNTIDIKWLSAIKLGELIKYNKIKIDHEKVGVDDKIVLTASSDELQKFIKKYMTSSDTDKWKTDIKLNLKRTHSYKESLDLMKRVQNGEVKLSGKISFN